MIWASYGNRGKPPADVAIDPSLVCALLQEHEGGRHRATRHAYRPEVGSPRFDYCSASELPTNNCLMDPGSTAGKPNRSGAKVEPMSGGIVEPAGASVSPWTWTRRAGPRPRPRSARRHVGARRSGLTLAVDRASSLASGPAAARPVP